MINKTGLAGLSKNISKPRGSKGNLQNSLSSLGDRMVIGRVTDIVLDENHPKFEEVGGLNGIGTIFYEIDNLTSTKDLQTAKSLHPQNKTFPLINEIVLLFSLPNNQIGSNPSSKSYYYINNINIWNHPHHNAYPNLLDGINDETQGDDYTQTEAGSVRRVTDDSTEINLNSKLNPSQNTFIERTNIHPLMPFMGDVIYEGRFGNSIRLGTTSKSQSEYKNNWSTVGTNGDPINIFRSGQPLKSSEEGWIPITENINDDLSSFYQTTYQKIPIVVANDNYFSYNIKPTKPSEYTNPQNILNSDRIIINAKKDHVLISGEKSINLSSNQNVNVDAKQLYVDSSDVRLGSKEASEPMLLGNKTIKLFEQLLDALVNLTTALESDTIWPGGVSAPNAPMNLVASNVKSVVTNIKSQLEDTKSKISKTL